ncbi:MAG: hypothetical protein RLZZ94_1520 [Bacteroidota bacterium]
MFSRKIFLVIICLFVAVNLCDAQGSKVKNFKSIVFTDAELMLKFDRGVELIESGDIINGCAVLDSFRLLNPSQQNSVIKSNAMTTLAKYFFEKNKFQYVINYIDLAFLFGKDSISIDNRVLMYDMLTTSFHNTNNKSKEAYYSQLKKSISDSLQTLKMQFQVDSLKQALEAKKSTPVPANENVNQINASTTTNTETNNGNINYLLIISIGIVTIAILLFILLKKSKGSTSEKKNTVEIPKIDGATNKGNNGLIEKIAKVELVFIRAEILGEYGNKKTVVKIINDYNTQLPLIIKNLDEAITTNDNEPIINALSYLKPYLTAFGMSATLAMLNEVESEAPTEKTTKLLSRVFQIRNHIRRAHDESKALSEVLG